MDRSRFGTTTLLTSILSLVAAPGCGNEGPQHCGNADGGYFAEWDYNHGDRCLLQISSEGYIELAPSQLVLAPATVDQPSTGQLTIIGYAEGDEDGPSPKTYADGYVVDVDVSLDCNLLLSLSSSPEADVCLVDTSTHLRCLLNPSGVTSVAVSTSLDHPTADECEISVESGDAREVSTVSVAHDPAGLDLAIHVATDGSGCGTAQDPCQPTGGRLPESVCDGSSPTCDASRGSVAFSLAMEIEGVQAVIATEQIVDLTTQPQEYPAEAASFSTSATCLPKITDTKITKAGQSPTLYLCTGGRPGAHEILARTRDGTNSDSLFVSVPPIPAKITARAVGSNDASPYSYVFDVEDCDGQPLDEQLRYSADGGETYGTKSGTPILLDASAMSFVVGFESWERSCSLTPIAQ